MTDFRSGSTMRRALFVVLLALALVTPLAPTALAGAHGEETGGSSGPRSPTAEEARQDPSEESSDDSSSTEDSGSTDNADSTGEGDEGGSTGGSGDAATSGGDRADDSDARPGRPADPEDAEDDRKDRDAEAREDRNDRRPEGAGRPDRAEDARGAAFGAFHVSPVSRDVQGDYVAFRYGDARIENFSIGGTTLFDADVADGSDDEDGRVKGTVAHGSQVRVEMPTYRLKSHDNPTGATRIDTRDGDYTLRFAPATILTLLDNARVRFELGNVTGVVRGDGLTIENGTVRGGDEVLVLLDAPRGAFDVHRPAITEAIAKRHVGAELSVKKRDSGIEEESISYGNVTLTPITAEPGNLTVLIDGHGTEGRVVVINVDATLIGASTPEALRVLFDNLSISMADSLADVLDPADDGLQAEYYPVFDPTTETFQLIVSVPHYSVHTLSIGTVVIPVTPSVVVGLVAGVFLLVPSGWVLFRRK